MDVHETLRHIQKNLKAPKNQFNKFGGYPYRNCEDILEAVKKLLGGCSLTITDEIQAVGNRVYVKATATLSDFQNQLSVSAWAREPESRKGMDESQITGAASSYARKYALNGLFCIDDTKDADSSGEQKETKKNPEPKKEPQKSDAQIVASYIKLCSNKGMTEDDITDFENAICNSKNEADFDKLRPTVVDKFDATYSWWMEKRLT